MPEDCLHFACESASRLQGIVEDLCSHRDPSYHQFCTSIKTLLFEIVPQFQSLPDTESSSEKAFALLDELEKLCRLQHKIDPPAPREPGRSPSTEHQTPYSALKLLLQDTRSATQAIIDFACDYKRDLERRKLLACLRLCVRTDPDTESDRSILLPSNADIQAEIGERPECGREILLLHKTLSTYCFCIENDLHQSVAACIRLSSSKLDDSKVTFGVLFMSHPHRNTIEITSQSCWQDTEIGMCRTVQTGIRETNLEPRHLVEIGKSTSHKKGFCRLVTDGRSRGGGLLCFSATRTLGKGGSIAETKLYINRDLGPQRHLAVTRPSISLRRLLETASTQDLTEKKKEVLSLFLAKAAWQYYSSPWMAEPWDKDRVHFIPEKRGGGLNEGLDGIFVDDPLLSISIRSQFDTVKACGKNGEMAGDGEDDDNFFSVSHKIPKIQALGVMLMEIQLGRPIESLHIDPKYSHHCPDGFTHADTNYNICKDLIKTHEIFAEMETSVPMSDLLTNCIFPNEVFMPPHVKSLDDVDIRDALYNLVSRLEVWNSKRQPHNVRPLTSPDYTPLWKYGHLGLMPTFTQSSTLNELNKDIRCGGTMAQITNLKTTEAWLSRMGSLIHILKPSMHEEYEKVKVAVLDTGVYDDHVEAAYIKGYKDYVSGNDSIKCDMTGHGTTSIRLILEMCDSAHVYALRIFNHDTATRQTQLAAVEALDWCIQNNMDIVCMACGFDDDNEALRMKLRDASLKMLIVVAPTNTGNRHDIAYPARHEELVLPMFATDGNVKKSMMNPSQGPGKYNFAILGEDITNANGEVNSGTSYATAIAAGFAARLLDFSRHTDTKHVLERKAHEIKSKKGMTKILLAMTTNTFDHPFHCIRPWDLLPKYLEKRIPFSGTNTPPDDLKKKARSDICQMISLGIDGKWGFN